MGKPKRGYAGALPLPFLVQSLHCRLAEGRPEDVMIYIIAALLPPIGLLLNGQPFAALLNLVLIVPCLVFGLIFHILWLVPSMHAVIAVHMKREERRHREIVDAIERHGAPPGWQR
jgi:uncharacterized membrane protein YqaE (UPF0057 family)